MGKIYKKQYEPLYNDIDYRKELRMTSIINYFTDVTVAQSEAEGVGMEYLKDNNMGWVIYKWDVEIIRHPVYGEKITVSTNPVSLKKFYAYRIFEVTNEKGEVLCRANSMWLLINTVRRRAIRIPKTLLDAYGAVEDDSVEIEDVLQLEREDYSEEFKVRYSDIDTNMHVNNTKYIDWSIEAIPFDIVTQKRLNGFRMIFKKEVLYGHKITSLCEEREEGHYIHRIVSDDGTELNLCETFWS